MSKSRGLGRGLDSLIPSAPVVERNAAVQKSDDGVMEIRVDRIIPNKWQPRRIFDQKKLEELAHTIASHGLIQPLVVRRRTDGSYELIAGERRLRAIRDVLHRDTAPVRIIQADDQTVREMALVENLQRDDLNPIEEAMAFRELTQELGLTHEAIAEKLQVSRPKITNTMRLLELPEEIKQLVATRDLAAGSARALLSLSNPVSQLKLAKRAVAENLSTRQIEKLAADLQKERQRPPEKVPPPHVAQLEERLRNYFGTKAVVEDDQGKGRIILEYYSVDDADRILGRMGLPPE